MVEELRRPAAELRELRRRNEALALEVGQLRKRQVRYADEVAAKEEPIAALRRRVNTVEAERNEPRVGHDRPAESARQ